MLHVLVETIAQFGEYTVAARKLACHVEALCIHLHPFSCIHVYSSAFSQDNMHQRCIMQRSACCRLVHRKGRLWELDGRKSFPIDHGETSPEKLLPVSEHTSVLSHPHHMHCVWALASIMLFSFRILLHAAQTCMTDQHHALHHA